jgi:hypothetical protein
MKKALLAEETPTPKAGPSTCYLLTIWILTSLVIYIGPWVSVPIMFSSSSKLASNVPLFEKTNCTITSCYQFKGPMTCKLAGNTSEGEAFHFEAVSKYLKNTTLLPCWYLTNDHGKVKKATAYCPEV